MPLERLQALVAKVDDFFARVERRHGDRMRCAAGCHDCCRVRLSVTAVEAEAVRRWRAALPAPDREALAAAARAAPRDACAALDADGRCRIYPARPLVCRSHGLPIRLASPGGAVVIQSCHLNFAEEGPEAADPDCVLDQTTLSTVLAALDAAFAKASGRTPGERVELADLLTEASQRS